MWKNSSFCANFYLNKLTYMPEDIKLHEFFSFYAAGCVWKIVQKLCHLVIHLPIISHKVRWNKCSLFILTRFQLNQKCNLFGLV